MCRAVRAAADRRRAIDAGRVPCRLSRFTRQAHTLDLRQFTTWCLQHQRHLFDARRVDIEMFARSLEDAGRARATVARRLCTVAGFYRYAVDEGVLERSPAAHVRRPRLDYESHVAHLDRNEVGALLVAAGLSNARDHALVSLLALNGLRVSEALGADIGALGLERGHRTLTVLRKGGKIATMPLAPRVARAVDLAIGERVDGPIFIDTDGIRLDRHAAGRIVRRIAHRAGIDKRVGPHTLRRRRITLRPHHHGRSVLFAALNGHAGHRPTPRTCPRHPQPRPGRKAANERQSVLMTPGIASITFDSADQEPLARWWAERFGGDVIANLDEGAYLIVAGGRLSSHLGFQRFEDPTPGKNEVH